MRLNDDDKTVAAMDVLVPGVGELIGGSQREERFDVRLVFTECACCVMHVHINLWPAAVYLSVSLVAIQYYTPQTTMLCTQEDLHVRDDSCRLCSASDVLELENRHRVCCQIAGAAKEAARVWDAS